jgi:ABC-2 type transport system ATP-binding protein
MSKKVLLSIQDIVKVYPALPNPVQALKGVSLDVHQGEVLSLLGVNGAGKTTLSSIIATVHPPSGGDIVWEGRSIYRNLLNYRRTIGFCPQKQNFDILLTVSQNLLFAGRYFLLPERYVRFRVNELIEQFGLGPYRDSLVTTLSAGYGQRVLIARSLIHNPSLVILDEPTIALDPHIRRQIWDIIIALKKNGITVIFTTHYIDEAEILSDRVCIMERGMIRLIDTPAKLLSDYNKPRLEDVFLELTRENSDNRGVSS